MTLGNQTMQISTSPIDRSCTESEIYNELLSLDYCNILELGCGAAELTREIANAARGNIILATEVDEAQHGVNLLIDDLPNVKFELAGAQSIPAENNFFDVVFMFKSLHHVPVDLMPQSLDEIRRVLKPGGYAYISEPIFEGDFNEVLRLFHDEQAVREAAFATVESVVEAGHFELSRETFFNSSVEFADFCDFENRVIQATHSSHLLPESLFRKVKQTFLNYAAENLGRFTVPIRVDLLHKPLT